MYGGANSSGSNNSMLYGGPLGTYLSGIYQPINSRNKSTSSTTAPKVGRRGSLRTGINNLSTPSTSSLYYTPQPRRRTDVSEPSKYTTPSYTTTPSTTTSSRPRSYYTPSANTSVSPSRQTQPSSTTSSSYSRPSSMLLRPHHTDRSTNDPILSPTGYCRSSYRNSYVNTDSNNDENKEPIDYKKLYEQELNETSQLRKEIEEAEQELQKVRETIEKKKHTHDDSNELEQLKCEGDTLKAENRALSRVVTRLSREK